MSFHALFGTRLKQLGDVLRWTAILIPMAVIVGSLCAGFLWALDAVTMLRFAEPNLLYGLPLAGFAVALVYRAFGRTAEGGNNLIVEQIHEPGAGVPLRMAPLILISTIVTHLFGGSAGREGTAVQLGGSIAAAFGVRFRLVPSDIRLLLMAGIAAGFGAVFGTPIAGAIFALEVLAVGRIQYEALIPCLLAAIAGDWSCHAWGIEHVHYHIDFMSNPADAIGFHIDALLLLKVAIAGLIFGLIARFFADASHLVQSLLKKALPYSPLRAAFGGLIVIGLVHAVGTRQYLGLGVWSPNPADATIAGFFDASRVDYWSWLLKILFTVVTLSSGFKGGEVTPLFFIGAALGNALAAIMGAPVDLFAALGFVAVFAGASNTPLACMIMGIELFGSTHTVYIAVACFLAYLASGHSGIYLSQKLAVPKTGGGSIPPDMTLRLVRELEPSPIVDIVDRLRPIGGLVRSSINKQKAPETMPYPHHVSPKEVGMVRIYMKPRERVVGAAKSLFGARPLYRELVMAAKDAGIMNAVAHHTHFGYSNHGKPQDEGFEIPNPDLTMCVELIGQRQQLETFCSKHGASLRGKVIIYKQLEHWDIVDQKTVAADVVVPIGSGKEQHGVTE